MVEKFPTVLEKLPQNLRGDFLTHTVVRGGRLKLSGVRQNLARFLHVLRFFKTALCTKIQQKFL